MTSSSLVPSDNYMALLTAVKSHVSNTQEQAILQVNHELILMNWQIGNELSRAQSRLEADGSKGDYLAELAKDLAKAFPNMKGLSRANLYKMRRFAEVWPDVGFVSTVLRQIPWSHNLVLLEKLDNQEERVWYAQQAINQGWSSRVLTAQIANKLKDRSGTALTNFENVLPVGDSELAQESIKSEYVLDFLKLIPGVKERALEDSITNKIVDVIQELGGPTWSFCGRQVKMDVEGQEFYIDLLFYHRSLQRLIIIDLKIEDFKPEMVGKMGFYQTAADDLLRQPGEGPSIGLILCTGGNHAVVKYALRNAIQPIGVSTYTLGETDLSDELPSERTLEQGIQAVLNAGK